MTFIHASSVPLSYQSRMALLKAIEKITFLSKNRKAFKMKGLTEIPLDPFKCPLNLESRSRSFRSNMFLNATFERIVSLLFAKCRWSIKQLWRFFMRICYVALGHWPMSSWLHGYCCLAIYMRNKRPQWEVSSNAYRQSISDSVSAG